MSDVRERAKAALEGVTQGPWDSVTDDDVVEAACVISLSEAERRDGFGYCVGGDLLNEDAMFIAAARTLVPELVAENEQLEAEIERLRDLIRRGLAVGDQFRTPYAAGARAELRKAAGMFRDAEVSGE